MTPLTCDARLENCGRPAPFEDGEAPSSRGVTTTVFGATWTSTAVRSVDLLLVIDDSISMADKQARFAEAAARLVASLLAPPRVDGDGNADKQARFAEAAARLVASLVAPPRVDGDGNEAPRGDGACPDGTWPAPEPVRDLHVGVVSSSLGGHGGIACTPNEGDTFVPEKDERGELIAPLRGIDTPDDLGFFAGDGNGAPGELAGGARRCKHSTRS